MKKIIIAIVAVVVLLGGAGAGAYVYFFKMKHSQNAEVAPLPKPQPIFFAQINNLVVSVPTSSDSGANQVFIELTVQFSTTDPKAITSFTALQPIIQAEMVSMLMKKTSTSLMDPGTHQQLNQAFLAIVNGVLAKNEYFTPVNPFTAAYITNIVQQD